VLNAAKRTAISSKKQWDFLQKAALNGENGRLWRWLSP